MKPSDKYYEIIRQSNFAADAAQIRSITLLDNLFEQICRRQAKSEKSFWNYLFSRDSNVLDIKGLYFWGGVGRGKTFLMDVFFQCLPAGNKKRCHFHEFMNQIHGALKSTTNRENPLSYIARDIASGIDILCLDEFVISDIGDAMIMAGLLRGLFDAGVILVTTSNTAPQNLYRDGLQRARFLPAIDLICEYCETANLDAGKDYRLLGLQQADLYTVPHSELVDQAITHFLGEQVSPVQCIRTRLAINGRNLQTKFCAEDTVWFSFDELCKTNRSQQDYLELARLFNTIIVTDIPHMSSDADDEARRFVLLIDILYDHHVKLICSAAATADRLYEGNRLKFEFERSVSRLIEMQSLQYLEHAHTQ